MADPWEPEIDFTHDWARALIEGQFPELSPVTVEALGQGWDNVALLVNGEWVFRFPQREVARSSMCHETACLTRLPELLPLPVPVYLGRPRDGYPYPFSGYRMLAGRTACSTATCTRAISWWRTRAASPA